MFFFDGLKGQPSGFSTLIGRGEQKARQGPAGETGHFEGRAGRVGHLQGYGLIGSSGSSPETGGH